MYLIDTSIIVDIFRGNRELTEKLDKLIRIDEIYLNYIVVSELFKGAFLHSKPKEKINQVKDFIGNFEMIDFNIESCEEFGKIYSFLKNSGELIPEFDIMLASIAKASDLTLVTKDKKHFQDIGIKVEQW